MEYIVLGVEPCGCKVIKHPDRNMNPFIKYCPFHKAAPELYEFVKEMAERGVPSALALIAKVKNE